MFNELRNNTVIVADCTGNLHHTISMDGFIMCITISPDKECLAICDSDGVHLLDLKTGKLRRSLKKPKQKGLEINRDQIAFSPDGQLLASTDGLEIALWDLHARRRSQVLRIGEYVGGTSELDFSADGSLFVECGHCGTAYPLSRPTSWSAENGLFGKWLVSCGFLTIYMS
jgi:WD40 repeat protein